MVALLIGVILMMMMIEISYSYMNINPCSSYQLHHYNKAHRLRYSNHNIHYSKYNIHHRNLLMKSNSIDSISNDNSNDNNVNLKLEYILAFIIIPLLSLVIPSLLSVVVDVTTSLNIRNYSIISLLLFKRIYLYTIAIVIVSIAAKRSFALPKELGKRLSFINTEALGINLDDFDITENSSAVTTNTTTNSNNNILVNIARMERESNSDMYESLDQVY